MRQCANKHRGRKTEIEFMVGALWVKDRPCWLGPDQEGRREKLLRLIQIRWSRCKNEKMLLSERIFFFISVFMKFSTENKTWWYKTFKPERLKERERYQSFRQNRSRDFMCTRHQFKRLSVSFRFCLILLLHHWPYPLTKAKTMTVFMDTIVTSLT